MPGLSPESWAQTLRRRLRQAKHRALPMPFGRLVRATDLRLEAVGCDVPVGTSCEIETGMNRWSRAEVVGFDCGRAQLLALDPMPQVEPGARIFPLEQQRQLEARTDLLGRVLDGAGRPLDDGPAPARLRDRRRTKVPVNPLQRQVIATPMDVGVRAVNALYTVGVGQRMGLFAPSGVGKSVLLGMMARFTSADVVVVGLVGERGREVREFIERNLGPEGRKKAVVVAAPAGTSPLLRSGAADLAVDLAAGFAAGGAKVLLLVDSITRYAEARREIALAAGELPAARGFPASVFTRLVELVERTGTVPGKAGAVSALFTVLTQDDALADPIGEAARGILDGHLVLSREVANQGVFPALEIESSVSRAMDHITSPEQQSLARRFKRLYARYNGDRELIAAGAYVPGNDPVLDEAVARYPSLQAFIEQPEHSSVPLVDSAKALESVLSAPVSAPGQHGNKQQSTPNVVSSIMVAAGTGA